MALSVPLALRRIVSPTLLMALSLVAAAPPAPARGLKPLARNLWVDRADHRVVLAAKVCLRKGDLEHLLCLYHTKEHEAVLTAQVDPKALVAALFLIQAEPGHPVRYDKAGTCDPPTGSPLAIDVEWLEGGKTHRVSARQWVRNLKTGKPLNSDWVFASDGIYKDPVSKQEIFVGGEGNLITVSNFTTSIIDVPFESSEVNADHSFQAYTEHIPAVGTPVTVILQLKPSKAKPAGPQQGA